MSRIYIYYMKYSPIVWCR